MKLLFIKLSSLLIMAYSLIFLAFFGGLEVVGEFSALTALVAPFSMFAAFRYIEFISKSEDREAAFILASSTSLFVYGIFLLPVVLYLGWRDRLSWLFFVFIFQRALELLSDHFIAFYSSSKLYEKAIFSLLLKIVIVVFSSLFLLFALEFDPFESAILSLVIAFVVGVFGFDLPGYYSAFLSRFSVREKVSYFIENFHLGVMSFVVSLNSVAPRYFLMGVGDYKFLGFFTLLYQISATVVNVFQFAISVNVRYFSDFVGRHNALMLFLILVVPLVSSAFLFQEINWNESPPISIVLFLVAAMTATLLVRGVYMSVAVYRGGYLAFYAVFISLTVTSISLLSLNRLGVASVTLYSFGYVVLSCSVCAGLILLKLKKYE